MPLCLNSKVFFPTSNSTSTEKLPSELRSTFLPFIVRGEPISEVPVITVFDVVTVVLRPEGDVILNCFSTTGLLLVSSKILKNSALSENSEPSEITVPEGTTILPVSSTAFFVVLITNIAAKTATATVSKTAEIIIIIFLVFNTVFIRYLQKYFNLNTNSLNQCLFLYGRYHIYASLVTAALKLGVNKYVGKFQCCTNPNNSAP